jgi:S1-C subfamily serine protease
MIFTPTFTRATVLVVVGFLALGIIVGGLTVYFLQSAQVNQTMENVTGDNNFDGSNKLSEIYNNSRESVVLITSVTDDGTAQGSGFVYEYSGQFVVVTNHHVGRNADQISVTFSNGQGYAASVIGSDSYVDLAVLSVEAPNEQINPLTLANSSNLFIGQPVLAMGSPYGLAGSLSTGIVSGLGRTLTAEASGTSYAIANVIQLTAPINPGNSGGPLLNTNGEVIGITTAIIAESQSIGFAVPSNIISREIGALIENGTYTNHSYLGISGEDMTYFLAQEIGVDITYGELVQTVVTSGPSYGKLQVKDIIVGINQTRITSSDDLAGYLADKTLPGDTVVIEVQRNNQMQSVDVVLESRPPAN